MFIKKSNLFALLGVIVLFSACKKEGPIVEAPSNIFTNSAFIINEGPFGDHGSIDVLNRNTKTIQNDVFSSNNGGDVLGDIVQSMTAANNKFYVVVNNSNVIKVINALDFKLEKTIEGFAQPRFIAVNGQKAYVSQWGPNGVTGSIAELDLSSNEITKTVSTNAGPEGLMVFEDKLIVPCSGGYTRDSVVQIFNLSDLSLVKTIVVGDNPLGVVRSADNQLWVTARGYTDWNNPVNTTSGSLVVLDPTVDYAITSSVEISNGSGSPHVNSTGDIIYYSDGISIRKVGMSDPSSSEVVIDGYFYGFDVDPATGNIYCADAKDFASLGEVKVFDPAGNLLYSSTTGIIPSHFYFVD